MVHSSLSSFAVVSTSVAASLLETFPYHPFNGPFLSLIFRRRLPERGSESFRDLHIILSMVHSSPIFCHRLPERGNGFHIILSLIFRHRLPERGSESFRDFSISSFPSSRSIPLKDSSFAVAPWDVAFSSLIFLPSSPWASPYPWAWQRETFPFILSMVHSSLSSFAVVSLSVAASLLETFPYHPFNGPFLSPYHLSPLISSPWAWQRVF